MSLLRRTSRTRSALIGTAVALLLATVGVAADVIPAGAANTLAVNCSVPPTGNTIFWLRTGESLSVTMSNCDSYTIFGDTSASGPGTDGTIEVPLDSGADFFRGGSVVYGVSVKHLYPETVPAGELLATSTATIPATAPEMNVGAPTSGGEHELGGDVNCPLRSSGSTSNHVYSTINVDITVEGTYTFRGVSTEPLSRFLSSLGTDNPIGDPFLALYSSFDPTKPDTGIIGCSDDLNDRYGNSDMAEALTGDRIMEGHLPYFTADLTPGSYTLVLTLWDEVSSADWATDSYGPASVTFEMWGPTAGLCVSGETCAPTPEPTPVVAPAYTG